MQNILFTLTCTFTFTYGVHFHSSTLIIKCIITGTISPKASPRRTPKKRKSRASFRIPTCKRVLDLPALSVVQIPEISNKRDPCLPEVSKSSNDSCCPEGNLGNGKCEIEILSVIEPDKSCTSKTNVETESEIKLVEVAKTKDENCCKQEKLLEKISPVKKLASINTSTGHSDTDKVNSININCQKGSAIEVNFDGVSSDKASADESKLAENNKKSDDVDEGYFDSSYVDLEKIIEGSCVDASTETVTIKKNDATTVTEAATLKKIDATTTTEALPSENSITSTLTDSDDAVDALNNDFLSKLSISAAVQTEESEAKRRKVNKSCQITDEAVSTLNKKLMTLRNKLNKVIVEKDSVFKKNKDLEKSCSDLKTER